MAERKLGLKVEFRHGASSFREAKKRIVAKTTGAPRSFKDDSFHGSVRNVQGKTIPRCDQHTMVARRALRCRHTGEPLQQDHVVPHIGVVRWRVGRIDHPGIRGIAGRSHPRRTIQRIHFESRQLPPLHSNRTLGWR